MADGDWLPIGPGLRFALLGQPIPPHSDVSFADLLDREHHALRELSPAEVRETAQLRENFLAIDRDRVANGIVRTIYNPWI